ncbi:hypothetical protein K443DRAFT_12698 [Laccaria amethystina LaAM-08-1]|uniref:Nephrocystin 3-like N-terminal domain-containing protein n=1 Tax=Laccaria amethystina LaAM-08-1 TaxID=1095629 RepID=A0A0C9WQW1_9AGAR|nr:hypothetical protein K443DRAFT_12698 [Laccaria amethystina LaAM-08-1]
MVTDKSLLLGAIPANIEVQVEGIEEQRIRSYYFVRLYVDGQKVSKSMKSKPSSSVLKWKWDADNQTWFLPLSSVMKVQLYRGSKINVRWFEHLVGQHEGDVVAFLENVADFGLTDKKGNSFRAKMHIVLSPISGSGDNTKEFLDKVDADVNRLSSNGAVAGTVSTLGIVLQLTKTIMDNLSEVHPILKASWTIVSGLYEAVRETDIQDESIQELATTLREILGITKAIQNLQEVPDTTNVIKEINRQSLEVAVLIQEYTKLHFAVRTLRIQADLKSRIKKCQDKWVVLKEKLSLRVAVDTNIRVRRIEDHQLADEIHKWLFPPDSSRNQNEARGKRQDGTCTWFLETERFLEWQENPGFLWVKGKSRLLRSSILLKPYVQQPHSWMCSLIIDKLPQPTQSLGIAYFFFDGRDGQAELQLHTKLIRSLIYQLTDTRHGGIPINLAELHKKCGPHQPSDDQLQDILWHILDGLSDAYIVIDALDECTDHQKTLDWVKELVTHIDQNVGKHLHIVVTSRPEWDIEEVFGALDQHSIDVGETTANQDIMNKIETSLKAGAEGSFRWITLQLAELAKCSSTDEIIKQLAELPKGLDEIYNRILMKIDEKHRADVRTFLQWLAFSKCPMTIVEIAETITVDFAPEDGPVFNLIKRYIDPQDVLVRCLSLVTESGGK